MPRQRQDGHTVLLQLWTLVWLLSWTLVAATTSSASRQLDVARGLFVYVQPGDVRVRPRHPEAAGPPTRCIIAVDRSDVLSLQVGSLHPHIFDCDFPRDAVRYVHNGNPHLSADRVRLTVRQFGDAAEVVSDDVILTVRVTQPVGAIFASVAQPRPLTADTRTSALSNPITADVIQFRYNFSAGSVCTLRFSSADHFRSQWLVSGDLVASDGTPVGNLSVDCRDFLVAGFRYSHNAAVRAPTAVDYIQLTATVDDWSTTSLVERVFLPVRLVGAPSNSRPVLIRRSGFRFVAEQFAPMLLSSDSLSVEDDVTDTDDIVITVLSPSPDSDLRSTGYLVHRRDPWKPAFAFQHRDLVDSSVAFRPPTVDVPAAGKRIELLLAAVDGQFLFSDPVRLSVTVRRAQSAGPKIVHNRALTVVRGGSCCLGTHNLQVSGAADLERVEIQVLRGGPVCGNLTLRNGSRVDRFRWSLIQSCDMVYRHDASSSDATDALVLRLSDGLRSLRTRLTITVLPAAGVPPRLKLNDPTEVRQHGYAQMTTLHLDTTMPGFRHSSADVTYTVTSEPRFGQVLMMYRPMTRGRPVTRFSQLDLDKGHIWYRHFGRDSPLRDTFRFLLSVPTSTAAVQADTRELVHEIVVRPHAVDHPPRLVTPSPAALTVRETDVKPIARQDFRYRDGENADEDVVFVVTCQPFVVGSSLTVDAGLVAYHDDAAFRNKNSTIVPLRTFTQSMIDGEMVAYVPPMNDIGPHPLNVGIMCCPC